MADRNEDMDWLYRRDHSVDPERTKVYDEKELRAASQGQPQGWGQPQDAPPWNQGQAQPPRASSSPPQGPGVPEPSPRGRKRKRRPILRLIGLLFLAWVLFLVGTPIYAWLVGNTIDATPSGERPAEQPGTTVLLVGSDARENLTQQERARLGTGSTGGRRTDTMLLLHTPAKGKPVLLSLPRDSYVTVPGHGKNKLNAAYALGGAPLLVRTIESSTDIRIDGYLEIGFLGIVDMVDALGGIQVCPKFDIDDKDSHLTLSKGCQTVDGVTALGYVRMRKQDPNGDLGRVERQREVIAAIAKKAASPLTVINPVTYWKLNMAVASTVTRGKDTGLGQMSAVASGMLSTVTGSGLSLTVPVSNSNAQTKAGSAVIWDKQASAKLFGAIAAGDTTPLG